MLICKQVPIDPNNVPLASLVAHEEQVDVNFVKNNFNNNAYRNNFGNNNYKPIHQIRVLHMEIIMVTFLVIQRHLVMKGFLRLRGLLKVLCKLNMNKIRDL